MNRAVALLLSVSLLGCFPHSARKRTYAQLTEGGMILAGIAVGATSNTTADCDMMAMQGMVNQSCKDKAQTMSAIATVLVVGGLLGFVATISTAEDDSATKVISVEKTGPGEGSAAPAPADGAGSGSAAPGATEGSAATPPPADPNAAPAGGATEGATVPAPNQFQWR